MEKYTQHEEIGAGGSGARVYRATRRSDAREVALKRFLGAASTPAFRKAAETEAAVLGSLQHRNVLPLLEWFFDGDDVCLVTPLATPGSAPFVDKAPRLCADALAHVASEVAAGLEYLHGKGILHRDIKPPNLFLVAGGASLARHADRTSAAAAGARAGAAAMPTELPESRVTAGTVLLGDFGTAKVLESTFHGYDFAGTKPYMAPEVLRDEGEAYGASADIWSLGATLLALGTAHQAGLALEDRSKIKRGGWTLESAIAGLPDSGKAAWEGLGQPLRELIAACLRVDPAARPTASAVAAFPAVAAARAAAVQRSAAAAHRLALAGTESRLGLGHRCTAAELVAWLQARAGSDNPSMHPSVCQDERTLLQALQQLQTAAGTDAAVVGEAASALTTLLHAQSATLAGPTRGATGAWPARSRGGPAEASTVAAALTRVLEAITSPSTDAATQAAVRVVGGLATAGEPRALPVRTIARAAEVGTVTAVPAEGAASLAHVAIRPAERSGASSGRAGGTASSLTTTTASGPPTVAAAEATRPSAAAVGSADDTLATALGDAKGDTVVAAVRKVLATAAPDSLAAVVRLHLGGRGLQDADVEALAALLPRFTQLRELLLHGNSIGDAGALAVAAVLPRIPQLQQLHMFHNRIGDAGAAALAEALPHLSQLRGLELSGNSIGDAGAASLACAWPHLLQLTQLHLSRNSIGAAGAEALAESLPYLAQLRTLDLSANMIGDAGAAALAAALPRLEQLQRLSLASNRIGDAGVVVLAGALPSLKQLQQLVLGYNAIGDSGAAALATALSRLTQLMLLSCAGNWFVTAAAKSALEAACPTACTVLL